MVHVGGGVGWVAWQLAKDFNTIAEAVLKNNYRDENHGES